MPLHLLGKKSWNVYNTENIARVRRDEAAARAKNEVEQRRISEVNGEARLTNLRTEVRIGSTLNEPVDDLLVDDGSQQRRQKRRKLAGEDDTDQDIRLARSQLATRPNPYIGSRSKEDALINEGGNISLFPEPLLAKPNHDSSRTTGQRSTREDPQDQLTRDLEKRQKSKAGDVPWYSVPDTESRMKSTENGKDVWGNEDSGRQHRDQVRIDIADPLSFMKKGVKQLKETEQRRKDWMQQRERDLYEIERLAKEHHRRRKRSRSKDSLEGFELDKGYRKPTHHHRRSSRHEGARKESSHRSHKHRHRALTAGSRRDQGLPNA